MRNDRPSDVGPFVPDAERDQQRFYIVKELVNTEKSYVAGLKETIDKYYKPMLQLAQSKSDPSLNVEDLRLIFSQLENILPLNQNLLQSTQNQCFLAVRSFLTVVQNLKNASLRGAQHRQ